MIALVDLRAGDQAIGVDTLGHLPTAPALRWSAFLVRVGSSIGLPETVNWVRELRTSRTRVPVGLIGDFNDEVHALLLSLRDAGITFDPLVSSSMAPAGVVASRIVAHLRKQAVEGSVIQTWVAHWGIQDAETLDLLSAIAGHGVRGGKAYTLAALSRHGQPLSAKTVGRRLRARQLPTLGVLLREARHMAIERRMQLGMGRSEAVVAGGWHSAKSYFKAAADHLSRKRTALSNLGG